MYKIKVTFIYKAIQNSKILTVKKNYCCDFCDNIQMVVDLTAAFVMEGWDDFFNTDGIIGTPIIRHFVKGTKD